MHNATMHESRSLFATLQLLAWKLGKLVVWLKKRI